MALQPQQTEAAVEQVGYRKINHANSLSPLHASWTGAWFVYATRSLSHSCIARLDMFLCSRVMRWSLLLTVVQHVLNDSKKKRKCVLYLTLPVLDGVM